MKKIDIQLKYLMPNKRHFNTDTDNGCCLVSKNAIMKNDGVGKRGSFKLLENDSKVIKNSFINNINGFVFKKGFEPLDDRLVINTGKDVVYLSQYGVQKFSDIHSSDEISKFCSEIPTWLFDIMERFRLLNNKIAEAYYCKEQNWYGFRMSNICFIAQEGDDGKFYYSTFTGKFTDDDSEIFVDEDDSLILKQKGKTYKYDSSVFDKEEFKVATAWITPNEHSKAWVNEILEIKTKSTNQISMKTFKNYNGATYTLGNITQKRQKCHDIFNNARYEISCNDNSDLCLTGILLEGNDSR